MTLYAVSPALPSGLVLDPSTGIISGTPLSVHGGEAYTVTAINASGSTTAILSITVNDIPPRSLSYLMNPATYVGGTPIAANAPSAEGGAVTLYTVAPALPSGLELHPATGLIAGTPTAVAAGRDYTITAANSGGSTSVAVAITVVAPPGPSISSQPVSQIVVPGQAAEFSVTATGTGALAYQWRRNGTLLGGAAAATLTTGPLTGADDGAVFDVVVSDSFGSSVTSAPATVSVGGFVSTGGLSVARSSHFAALLSDGMVLIGGGLDASMTFLASAEVYDPAAGTFGAAVGSMTEARVGATAVPLLDGRVLVIGGLGIGSTYLSSAETYDPTTGHFTATGDMGAVRTSLAAVRLPNGKVLVTGGYSGNGTVLDSAELFDPSTNTFSSTGKMSAKRYNHVGLLLPSGRVLVAGGHTGTSFPTVAELYDPATETFSDTGTMTTARYALGAAALLDGRVLLVGGMNGNNYVGTAELYDPVAGTFAATGGMSLIRAGGTIATLSNGKVLVAGGQDMSSSGAIVSSSEVFSPTAGQFSEGASMAKPRVGMTGSPGSLAGRFCLWAATASRARPLAMQSYGRTCRRQAPRSSRELDATYLPPERSQHEKCRVCCPADWADPLGLLLYWSRGPARTARATGGHWSRHTRCIGHFCTTRHWFSGLSNWRQHVLCGLWHDIRLQWRPGT